MSSQQPTFPVYRPLHPSGFVRLFRRYASHSQNELRKAALERAGGGSRKAVLPPKDPKESSEPRVVDIDHLTRTQVIAGLMQYGQILFA